MCHKQGIKALPTKRISGSALVIAIFIIVVMTVIGTALVRMLSTSGETIAYEVLGTRAFYAAQTGLQRRLQSVFPLDSANGSCEAAEDISELSLSAISGLENCEIFSATCTPHATVDSTQYYTITSIGQCEVAGVFTSRTLEVQARDL